MNKELIDKIITYNYNEFGNEFGGCIVDMKKEIERLNNIINELEKYIKEQMGRSDYTRLDTFDEIYDKLQELKGDSSNE